MNGLAGCHQIHRQVFVGQGLRECDSSEIIANQYSEGVCFQIKVVVVFLLGTLLTGIQRCQRFPFVRSQFELGWRRSLKHGEKRVPKYSSFAQYRNQHRRPISAKEEENVISSPHTKWASIVITIHLCCFHFIIVSSAFIVWCEIKTWPFHTKC